MTVDDLRAKHPAAIIDIGLAAVHYTDAEGVGLHVRYDRAASPEDQQAVLDEAVAKLDRLVDTTLAAL